MPVIAQTVLLLVLSNVFLRNLAARPWIVAVLAS